MIRKFDFLVIGSGVAGMSYALQVAASGKGKVALVCKTTIEEANTAKAQGGVASVTNLKVDNFEKHIKDTLIAGDYISDLRAVEQVVKNAPAGIERLVKWGVNFDKKDDGSFDLHREGGHSEFRILHHADDTGFEIQRGLIEAVRHHPNITVLENHLAVEIITQHHLGIEVTRRTPDIECYGAYVLDPDTQKLIPSFRASPCSVRVVVVPYMPLPQIPILLQAMVSLWHIVPRPQWRVWSLFSSTPQHFLIRARSTLLIS